MAVSKSGEGFVMLLLVCGLLHCGSAADTLYNVGGDAGWTLQSSNSSFYQDWADGIFLYVGDALNFTLGDHSMVEVPVANLATCDNSTFFAKATGLSSTIVTVGSTNGAGTYGYFSDIGNDCSQFGMHFQTTWHPLPAFSGSPSPVESPAESPSETPVESPAESPAEFPAESPADSPAPTSGTD